MRPAWIAANVVAALQAIVADLETIYSSSAIDPAKAAAFRLDVATGPSISATTPAPTAVSAGLYPSLVALYNALPMLVDAETGIDPSVTAGIVALAEGLVAAMQPAAAAAAFAALADGTPDPVATLGATLNRASDTANMALVARFARMAWLAAYVEALVTQPYATRAQAITARADCVGRFERELDLCGLGPDIAVASALTEMRDRAVAYLTQAIVDARPVLTVSAPSELPAILAAWRLYGDVALVDDLLARNAVPVAEFMPSVFEAAAP